MAGKNFVSGQFCVARVNSQSLLQCLQKRENLGSRQLGASLLSAKSWLPPGCSTCFIACCKLGLID